MLLNSVVPGYNFIVFVGPLVTSFSRISGIENEIEVETLVEGGINDEVIILNKNRSQGGRLTFERGVGVVKRPLNIMFNAAHLGSYFRLPGTILILSADQSSVKKVYGYNGAIPVKWSLQDLDASTGQILIERVELIHQGIYDVSL